MVERVYPGAGWGTIGLGIQNRFNAGKYGCTRTFCGKGVKGKEARAGEREKRTAAGATCNVPRINTIGRSLGGG